jgi:biofilm protein TabA
MIHDSLRNSQLYEQLGRGFAAAFEYAYTFDQGTPDGRHEIDGEDVFALVQTYDTAPGVEKRFESHRQYVDVQFLASGRERILYTDSRELEVDTPYDEETDVVFYEDPEFSSSILLRTGEFVILYPQDAHKPGCMAGGREAVKKVVVKIRYEV